MIYLATPPAVLFTTPIEVVLLEVSVILLTFTNIKHHRCCCEERPAA